MHAILSTWLDPVAGTDGGVGELLYGEALVALCATGGLPAERAAAVLERPLARAADELARRFRGETGRIKIGFVAPSCCCLSRMRENTCSILTGLSGGGVATVVAGAAGTRISWYGLPAMIRAARSESSSSAWACPINRQAGATRLSISI